MYVCIYLYILNVKPPAFQTRLQRPRSVSTVAPQPGCARRARDAPLPARSRQGQAAAAGQDQGQPGAASGPGRAGLREGERGGELRAWRRPAGCSGAWCSPRAGTAPPSSSCTAQVAASFPLHSLLPSAAGQGLGGPRCLLRGLLGTAGPKGEEELLRAPRGCGLAFPAGSQPPAPGPSAWCGRWGLRLMARCRCFLLMCASLCTLP